MRNFFTALMVLSATIAHASVDDNWGEALRKSAEQVVPGQKAEYLFRHKIYGSGNTPNSSSDPVHTLDDQVLAELQDFHADNTSQNASALSEAQSFHADNNDRLGATSESAAATDTSTSGLNGLFKRLLQRLTTLINFYAADFGASSGAIRTAAQIGNATGAANFNAGTTGAQTLRTASNLYDGAANALTSRSYDSVRPLEVYVIQYGASNAAHTRITFPTGNVSTQIFAANSARKWLRIENDSGAEFFIKFGATAVVNQGISVKDKTAFVMSATELYLGAINAIVASNNRTIEVIEGY